MISYLSGKIKYVGNGWLILNVGGVGYKVFINSKAQITNNKQITNTNNKITNNIENLAELFIYHHIREDRSDLYGFKSIEELNIFELLLEVPGVGPKMGMNIMGKADFNKIKQAISKGDSGFFTAISGVGKKLATKIILELKNKFESGDFDVLGAADLSTELVGAMESLGYKKSEIYPMLAKIPESVNSTGDKVKWILKHLKSGS